MPAQTKHLSGDDFLLRCARVFFFFGLLSMPWLVLRPVGSVAASDVLLILAAGLTALAPRRGLRARVSTAWAVGAGLVAVGGGLASSRADSASISLLVAVRLLYLLLVFPWQTQRLLDSASRLNLAISAFILGAAVDAAFALGQVKFGFPAFASAVPAGSGPGAALLYGRALGLTGHPNDQGGVLAVAAVLAVGRQMSAPHQRRKITLGFALVIVMGLILSGSVTGMLAFLAGVAVYLSGRRITARGAVATGGAMLIAYFGTTALQSAVIGGLTPLERFNQATGGGSVAGQNTLLSRLDTDRIAISGIAKSPLIGRGLDASSGTVNGLPTHNMFLLAWWQGGFLVLLGLLLAIGSSVRPSALLSDRAGLDRVLWASFVAAIVYAMSAPVLYDRFFWLSAVLLFAARNIAADQPLTPNATARAVNTRGLT